MSDERNQMEQLGELREAVRQRLTMAELCVRDGLEGKREGQALRARCPFHDEKSESFLIGSRRLDTAHCFGCGWHGDIFAYWRGKKGKTYAEAVNELASLVGLAPVLPGVKWERPKATALLAIKGDRRINNGEKPLLPRMRALRDDEIVSLAALRGLSVESVTAAARVFKRVCYANWRLYLNKRENRWCSPCQVHWFRCRMDTAECVAMPQYPCWVITDDARWVAQFRKLDGTLWESFKDSTRKPWKADTAGTSKWPVGVAELGDRPGVLLVEGGPDILAGYHFLHRFGVLDRVAVVGMLGGSSRIAEAALPFFKGKRVRIMAHADEVKEDGQRPGFEAAYRWQEQLREAGAAVKTFNLEGLVRMDNGKAVKDVNDLAYCADDVIDDWEIRTAFTEWREGFGG